MRKASQKKKLPGPGIFHFLCSNMVCDKEVRPRYTAALSTKVVQLLPLPVASCTTLASTLAGWSGSPLLRLDTAGDRRPSCVTPLANCPLEEHKKEAFGGSTGKRELPGHDRLPWN
ncbi:uncharacterized protein J5F26_007987 isoform 1-T2 [Ciconia maguari]